MQVPQKRSSILWCKPGGKHQLKSLVPRDWNDQQAPKQVLMHKNTLAERGMSWCVWIVSHFCAALLEVRITGVRKALGKLVDGGGWSGDDWCTLCVLVGTPAPFKHTNIDWLLQGVIHRDTCQPTNQIIWKNTVFLMPHPDFLCAECWLFRIQHRCHSATSRASRAVSYLVEAAELLGIWQMMDACIYNPKKSLRSAIWIFRKKLWEVLYGYSEKIFEKCYMDIPKKSLRSAIWIFPKNLWEVLYGYSEKIFEKCYMDIPKKSLRSAIWIFRKNLWEVLYGYSEKIFEKCYMDITEKSLRSAIWIFRKIFGEVLYGYSEKSLRSAIWIFRKIFEKCYMDIPKNLWEVLYGYSEKSLRSAIWIFRKSLRSAIWIFRKIFEKCYMDIPKIFEKCYMDIPKNLWEVLYGYSERSLRSAIWIFRKIFEKCYMDIPKNLWEVLYGYIYMVYNPKAIWYIIPKHF